MKPTNIENLSAWMWQNSVYLARLEARIAVGDESVKPRRIVDILHLRELRRYLTSVVPDYDWQARPNVTPIPEYRLHLCRLDAILMNPDAAAKVSLQRRLAISWYWGLRTGCDPMPIEAIAQRFKDAATYGTVCVPVTPEEIGAVRAAYNGAMLAFGFGQYFGIAKNERDWLPSRWDLKEDYANVV